MTAQNEGGQSFESVGLISFLYSHRKLLIIITSIATVASAIFSGPFFITPLYESKVILFPGSTSSISKAVLNENAGLKNDVLQFGEEEEAEQMLQILGADDIRFKIIQKYDLLNHYEIDTAKSAYPMTKLNKKYDDNISHRRTKLQSIEIKVRDSDPDIAAAIVNDISNLLDSAKNKMQKEVATKAFSIVKRKFEELEVEIEDIQDSLTVLGARGIHDYKSQSEVLNRQYAEAVSKNDTRALQALGEKLDLLGKYGSTQMALAYKLENIYEEVYPILKRRYEEAKVDATETIPQKFVVNWGYPAEKKAYPIRWLIVVISALSAFTLAAVLIIISDNIKRIKS
ncbi:MAG: hypothetical protein JKY52_15020 [Flavobacteriales bacterium]|nr:hypothetical protein [Flavobacteriales bacterium]